MAKAGRLTDGLAAQGECVKMALGSIDIRIHRTGR